LYRKLLRDRTSLGSDVDENFEPQAADTGIN
jgi:hypothetical protein